MSLWPPSDVLSLANAQATQSEVGSDSLRIPPVSDMLPLNTPIIPIVTATTDIMSASCHSKESICLMAWKSETTTGPANNNVRLEPREEERRHSLWPLPSVTVVGRDSPSWVMAVAPSGAEGLTLTRLPLAS